MGTSGPGTLADWRTVGSDAQGKAGLLGEAAECLENHTGQVVT